MLCQGLDAVLRRQGPPSKDLDDGYAPHARSARDGAGLHASGDSSGALNELADPVEQVRVIGLCQDCAQHS